MAIAQQIKLEDVEKFASDILAKRLVRLRKDVGELRPKNAQWASGISECARQMVYSVTHWDQKKLHEPELQARFNEGRKQEDKLKVELREILGDLGSELVEEQVYLPKEFIAKYGISGKIDGKLTFMGRRLPMEVKSMHPNVYERMNSIEDMKADLFQRKSISQLLMYLFANDEEFGLFFLTDCLGKWKIIVCPLDYSFTEAILQRVSTVNEHVKAKTLPERILYSENMCGRCPWAHVCLPDVINEAKTVLLDNKELEGLLKRREELNPLRKEFEVIDDQIKGTFKLTEAKQAVVGDFIMTRRDQFRNAVDTKALPEDIKAKYSKKSTVTVVLIEHMIDPAAPLKD